MAKVGQLHKGENYRANVRIEEGKKVGILAFGGVELRLGAPEVHDEFKGATSGKVSVVFINDLKRSWWNNKGFEQVLAKSISFLKHTGVSQIYSIGNSMGGSAAILSSHFSKEIEKVCAFVPQADPYTDRRWNVYTDRIEKIRWSNFAEYRPSVEHLLYFGPKDQDDLMQIEHFKKKNFEIEMLENAGHNATKILKEEGRFDKIMSDFFEQK